MFAKLNQSVVTSAVRAFSSNSKALDVYGRTLSAILSNPTSSLNHIQETSREIINQFDTHFYNELRANIAIKPIGKCFVDTESGLVTTTMASFPLLGTYIEVGDKAKRPIPFAIITPIGTVQFLDLKHPGRVSTRSDHNSMQWIEHQWMSSGLFRCHFGEHIVYADRAHVANIGDILMPRAKILNEGSPELIKLYREVISRGVNFTERS